MLIILVAIVAFIFGLTVGVALNPANQTEEKYDEAHHFNTTTRD